MLIGVKFISKFQSVSMNCLFDLIQLMLAGDDAIEPTSPDKLFHPAAPKFLFF